MNAPRWLRWATVGLILGWGYTAFAQAGVGQEEEVPTWTPIEPKDRVLATAWGEETALLREAHLLTWPGAEAHPGFTSSLLVGRDGGRIPVQTVRVMEGRVDAVLVPSKEERGVLLAGPNSISAIANRGRVSMSVTKERVYVQALRDEALVGHRGLFKRLEPGHVRVFQRPSGKWEDTAPAAAPPITVETGLPLATRDGAEVSLRAASTSETCVALLDEEERQVGETQCQSAGAHVKLRVPRAGTYYAVGRAMGDGGLDGVLGDKVRLRVLGLADDEVTQSKGMLLLYPGERIRILGTEGLEMRVGGANFFVPAGDSIALAQGESTVIEYRKPGSPDESVQLRLAPRIGEVKTSLGPPGVTWPGRAVRLEAAVFDGAGNLLSGDEVRLELTVNSQKEDVEFRETPRGFVATVPSRSGPGPWVVRFAAYDGRGRMIARDVLEVVKKEE